MTDPDPLEELRAVARAVLRDAVESASMPLVPPPPVAAVLRPSTWTGPALPGEVIGDGAPAPAPDPGARVEAVTIDSDNDLERFVRSLLARLESPRERRAISTGRVRFTLQRATTAATANAPGPETTTARISGGAVTERAVRDAAQRGQRIVLAAGAVLTPLARDQARALGVVIEKEGRC